MALATRPAETAMIASAVTVAAVCSRANSSTSSARDKAIRPAAPSTTMATPPSPGESASLTLCAARPAAPARLAATAPKKKP